MGMRVTSANLKKYMTRKGITAAQLSRSSNVTYTVILDLLNEKKESIKLQHLIQIAEAIKSNDIRDIISLEDTPVTPSEQF